MVALVTGGRLGIGLAIVKALREEGHKVAVIAQHGDGPECDFYIRADLSQIHERHDLVRKVVDELGGLDILVNNAGEQVFRSALELEYTTWKHNLDVMLTAPFDLSQQAAKYMLKHGGGQIVNILSTSAFQGARNCAGYIAAKHGLLGLTRALALEWAPKVHVNAVAPGLTETDMTSKFTPERKELLNSITPGGRFCTPEEIADAVMFLINSSAMYGQTIIVDQGWMAKNG